jgi:protein-disulfide isomerase
LPAIIETLKSEGVDGAAIETCIKDEANARRIVDLAEEGQELFEISSTPTFIINGLKVTGALPFAEFDEILKPLFQP